FLNGNAVSYREAYQGSWVGTSIQLHRQSISVLLDTSNVGLAFNRLAYFLSEASASYPYAARFCLGAQFL
ncbi:MAG: hypothetical protein WHV44_14810, partial [Anaerolineales bacterium]